MATTEHFYTGNSSTTTYAYTFPILQNSDLKVELDGVIKTENTSGTNNDYSISGTNVVLNSAPANNVDIHIYRVTNVDSAKAVFASGSSIRAGDLNNNVDQSLYANQEQQQKIRTADVRDNAVTTVKIKDLNVTRPKIANDAIDGTKIADDSVDSEHIAADSLDTEHYAAGSVDTTALGADSVTGAKIGDDQINSEHYVSGSIDLEHMSANSVDSDQYVDGSIDLIHMSANSVDSDQYVDGSIDRVHLEADIIDGTKLADNAVDSEHITSGSVDLSHMSANSVDSDQYVDGSIDRVHLEADIIDSTKLADDAVGAEHIQANAVTDSEIATGTLDNRYFTETEITGGAADGRYYTETELDAGQLDNRYFTETELTSGGAIDSRYYTEAELNGGQLNSLYFTESEITGGAADGRYYTETELDAGQLDNRYFTETELTGGALDGRYYTETEAEAKFLRQDSSETIASGATWSNSDAFVATTAAINARIIDLIDDVGGFTTIATELLFPNTNPQGTTGQAAILSIGALSQGYTRTGTTVTIANGTVGNSTVTITGVPLDLPSGFGLLVESTATLNQYTFHRLVPKATEVTTVATNITNIVAAGANVSDINNFADLYQISGSAPTQRVDGNSLVSGDLWFDNSNGNLRVWNGSAWAIITPAQSVLDDVAIVSGAITYSEDLGLIGDAVTTGSSNGSLDIVADALEDEITFAITVSSGAYFVDGVSKPALTLYKGWTYTFDVSDSSNGSHPLRFSSGGSAYNTGVTVTGTQGQAGAKVQLVVPESQPTSFIYYCTNHSGMGNTITVKDDPIKTVSDNVVKIIATADNSTNINTVAANNSNVTAVAGNSSNINSAVSNASNINAAVSNATNINAVAGNNTNITAVANNSSNINSAVSNASNINSAVSNASNINSVVSNATNINTVATNVSDVNNFADQYQIASSAPSTDGGGNALSVGDLYFNSSANELRIWNGSQWQGGVTATGALSQVSGSVFTGDNRYNDNIKVKFGADSDLQIFHNTTDSIINASGTGNIKLQDSGNTKVEVTSTGATVTGLMTATTIDGSAGNNLTLDFGTL
jgi:hypothetical protein